MCEVKKIWMKVKRLRPSERKIGSRPCQNWNHVKGSVLNSKTMGSHWDGVCVCVCEREGERESVCV